MPRGHPKPVEFRLRSGQDTKRPLGRGGAMGKRNEPYRYCIVESYYPDGTAGLHGPIHIRPVPGQQFPTHLHVECSKDLVNPKIHPVGTLLSAPGEADRSGGRWRIPLFLLRLAGRSCREVKPGQAKGRRCGRPFLVDDRRECLSRHRQPKVLKTHSAVRTASAAENNVIIAVPCMLMRNPHDAAPPKPRARPRRGSR